MLMERQTRHPDFSSSQRRTLFLRLAALAVAIQFAFTACAATFTTSLDRERILLGETVTLTLSIEGATPTSMPQLPGIPGLQVAGGMNYGTSSSTGPDGRMHTVTTFSVPLAATKTGEFQIPAFQLELAGQKLSSAPLRLTVLAEDGSGPPPELGQVCDLAILKIATGGQMTGVGPEVLR